MGGDFGGSIGALSHIISAALVSRPAPLRGELKLVAIATQYLVLLLPFCNPSFCWLRNGNDC